MNWLTLELTQPQYQHELLAYAERVSVRDPEGDSLRLIQYQPLAELIGLPQDAGPLLEGFLLCESAESAASRASLAILADYDDEPRSFTLALDGGTGTVFYLPENRDEAAHVQLFTDYGGNTARVRAETLVDQDTAGQSRTIEFGEIEPAFLVEGGCADGPCKEWREGCGPNECRCRMYTTADQLGPPGRLLRSRKVSAYGLKCR